MSARRSVLQLRAVRLQTTPPFFGVVSACVFGPVHVFVPAVVELVINDIVGLVISSSVVSVSRFMK